LWDSKLYAARVLRKKAIGGPMRNAVMLTLLLASTCFAAESTTPTGFQNPDGTTSFGLNFYRSPLHGGRAGTIDEKTVLFDMINPMGKTLTFNTSIGLKEQSWHLGGAPSIFKGKTYSVGFRLYLDDSK
jgi:hypothetical protein